MTFTGYVDWVKILCVDRSSCALTSTPKDYSDESVHRQDAGLDPIKCEETTTIITPNTKFDIGKIIW
jgi:hypothetical protein